MERKEDCTNSKANQVHLANIERNEYVNKELNYFNLALCPNDYR